ncbi:MAG: helix-turn-helix transcriptional regulator [Lachnospiraceae bacterium]|nr:helix-turn-helix transcriptional regulator [Lachnospiraceae bacterium]
MRRVLNHADAMVTESEEYSDEYELIEIAFNRLYADTGKMKTAEYRYKQNAKKEMLQMLLYGDGSQIRTEQLREAGVVWDGDIFCVARVSMNHLETLKEIYSYSDMKLFSFAIINIMEEYLRNAGYTVYGVDNVDYSVSIIIQLEEEYENSSVFRRETFPLENITEIQKILYGAKQELERILNSFTVFIGVGRSVKGYDAIHRSWLDTQYATIYRFTRGDQLVTLFTSHMESYESGIQYPWDIEKKLLSNMKAAKEEAVLTALEEFFAAVQKMAPDEMRWAINQLLNSIFRIGMMNNFKMKDGNPLDWKIWIHELNATDTKYEMKDVLIRLILNLSMEDEESESGKKKLADSVKQYVDEHFFEEMISVSEVASQMGYSVNYVRQVFKEIQGSSVSDYILEKRMEKARELLLTTNYTSKKIAQMVGYTDNRYFYVVFKKKTGETADSFRKRKNSN